MYDDPYEEEPRFHHLQIISAMKPTFSKGALVVLLDHYNGKTYGYGGRFSPKSRFLEKGSVLRAVECGFNIKFFKFDKNLPMKISNEEVYTGGSEHCRIYQGDEYDDSRPCVVPYYDIFVNVDLLREVSKDELALLLD